MNLTGGRPGHRVEVDRRPPGQGRRDKTVVGHGMVRTMAIRERLIDWIHRSARSSTGVRSSVLAGGGAFLTALVASLVLISIWLDAHLGLAPLLGPPVDLAVGLPVAASGLLLMAWSVVTFLHARGTPVPLNPPPRLVTSGPYARTRNPMLTGVFAVMFGLGLLLGSASLVLLLTPLYILFIAVEIKLVEEPELERRLGRDYIGYRDQVPMFVPWPGRRARR
jgi:protein-S-isoprenylcysteine O-methyltransferase Ste14